MSAPPQVQGETLTDKAQLIAYLEAGCKPPADWRIGTEHEKFCYTLDDFRPLPYHGERSIEALLKGLQAFGWDGVKEGENVIALTHNGASVSLEPGGQVELSGAPLETIHDTCSEVHIHLDQIKKVTEPMGVAAMG
ncbi:MAG TPA: glutamate--cysteine ligase, partial [Kiloniellaceae bacterium]|nr:glutamate--cysteine ligase [Kiloniellaceae bacterium]